MAEPMDGHNSADPMDDCPCDRALLFCECLGRKRCVRQTSRGKGPRCTKAPVTEATVCASHGAAKGSVVRKVADEKVVEQKVMKRLQRYRQERRGVSPAQGYRDALELSAAITDAALELAADKDEETTEAELLVLHRIALDHGRISTDGVAGVEQQRLELEAAEVHRVVAALEAVLRELGLDDESVHGALKMLHAKLSAVGP